MRLLLLSLLGAARGQDEGRVTCEECLAIQEGIHRTINHNISALETKSAAGTTQTERIEIGQLIWHLCDSPTWKEQRHHDEMTRACRSFARVHVDVATRYWQEKSSDEYQDPVLALQMKRAVCTNPDIDACRLADLPDAYSPLGADECDMCHAVVADLYRLVQNSIERPRSGKSDPYFRLVEVMSEVCTELPMRHEIRAEKRADVLDACVDVWDDYEATLSKMALKRDLAFARSICTEARPCARGRPVPAARHTASLRR